MALPLRRGFRRSGASLSLRLDAQERAVLTEVLGQLATLLEADEADGPPEDTGGGAAPEEDPWEALVGIAPTASRPADPALARLLPDGYDDDDEAAADFRRYTENDLRQEKATAIGVALDTLALDSDRMDLDAQQADAWVRVLNDLRLVVGTRIGVDADYAETRLDDDDPRAASIALYDWLTWLQSTLVSALMRR